MLINWYRFSRTEILRILPFLALNEISWAAGNQPSEEFALCVLLARMAYPLRYSDLIPLFGRSPSYMSSMCTDVVTHIQRRFEKFLFWDHRRLTVERLKIYAKHIERAGGTNMIWGYIDGTLQRICRPTNNQRLFYSGHKHFHGFKYQGVISPDGLFASVFGPIVGSRGDWFVYGEIGLGDLIDGLFANVPEPERIYLYGDPAYHGSNATIGAFRRPRGGNLAAEQRQFNKSMSKLRIAVEHGFGQIQRLWIKNVFYISQKAGQSPVASYYLAAILFTNIMACFRGNQISEMFECDPPSLEEYLENFV